MVVELVVGLKRKQRLEWLKNMWSVKHQGDLWRPTGATGNTSVLPCQYHSTIVPHTFIHLPPTLYNVFLPVLQFSPVSIIPTMLRTHHNLLAVFSEGQAGEPENLPKNDALSKIGGIR